MGAKSTREWKKMRAGEGADEMFAVWRVGQAGLERGWRGK